jgi:hypothetical protein
MPAAKLKLKIDQGSDFVKSLTWKAGDPTPVPVDITGFTARMQLRQTVTSSTVLLELTTENGGITLGGVLGTINIAATAVQTAALTQKSAVYDLEMVYPGGAVRRLIEGTVTISPEVTR